MDQLEDQDGITAYHGSPHDFEKFDLSKIGTGEGAQAYGHGLYFAQSEPIAKSYRDTLTKGAHNLIIDGKSFDEHYNSADPEKRLKAKVALAVREGKSIDEAIDWVKQQTVGQLSSRRLEPEDKPVLLEDLDRLQKFKTQPPDIKQNPGHMYEVSINAHPDHFFDWDKPIERQHPVVQKAIMSLPYANEKLLAGAPNLMFALEDMRSDWMQKNNMDTRGRMDHRRHVSEDLAKAGLPGIKYLDANSRTPPPNLDPDHIQRQIERNRTQAAQVTDAAHRADLDDDHNILLERLKKAESYLARNYVVFDHDLVNVKRKYARGGVVNG